MQLEFLAGLGHKWSAVLNYGVRSLSYKLTVHSLPGSFPPSNLKTFGDFEMEKNDILTTLKTVLGRKKRKEHHMQTSNTQQYYFNFCILSSSFPQTCPILYVVAIHLHIIFTSKHIKKVSIFQCHLLLIFITA